MAELKDGILIHPFVNQNIIPYIERAVLDVKNIKAIVVHQTDNFSAERTFNGWKDGNNPNRVGAHFVIDRGDSSEYKGTDGKIYQTAHLNKTCSHVGYIQSRCYLQKSCVIPKGAKVSPEAKALDYKKGWADRAQAIETKKSYPDRFPMNSDSLGIEIVSKADAQGNYPKPSPLQMKSLAWLISGIISVVPGIDFPTSANDVNSDIYAHGVVGRKQPSEAKSAADDLIGVYVSNAGLGFLFYMLEMQVAEAKYLQKTTK